MMRNNFRDEKNISILREKKSNLSILDNPKTPIFLQEFLA
jgi:hypothetical protein